jgi:hypothetical protein
MQNVRRKKKGVKSAYGLTDIILCIQSFIRLAIGRLGPLTIPARTNKRSLSLFSVRFYDKAKAGNSRNYRYITKGRTMTFGIRAELKSLTK